MVELAVVESGGIGCSDLYGSEATATDSGTQRLYVNRGEVVRGKDESVGTCSTWPSSAEVQQPI